MKSKRLKIPVIEETMNDQEREAVLQESQSALSQLTAEIEKATKDFDELIEKLNKLLEPSGKKVEDLNPAKIKKYLDDNMSEREQRSAMGIMIDLQTKERKSKTSKKGSVKSGVRASRFKI